MFGRGEASEAQANAQERQFPIPALRTFRVTRSNYNWSEKNQESFITEAITAHAMQGLDQQGTVWGFVDYVIDPVMGPNQRLHRVVSGVVDIQEVSNPNTSPLAI